MAQTLPNGAVVPNEDGKEQISRTGVQEMRTLGSSLDTAVGNARFTRGSILGPADAFALGPGIYTIGALTWAQQVANLPEIWPGTLIVEANPGSAIRSVEFKPYQRDYTWETVSTNASGDFMPWRKVGVASFLAQDPGLMHTVQREAFRRRRGGTIGTGGLPVVSLRFDHGLGNFRDLILPHLERLNLPWSLAMNSGEDRWALPEQDGATGTDLNTWALRSGGEVWNHGRSHRDASSISELSREIVTGKEELQAQVPDVPIEGWVVPGVGGSGYGGFSGGQTPAHWDTIAGRLILASHGASSSHSPGMMSPVAGGAAILGRQFSIDASTANTVNAELDVLASSRQGGMILFLHPSQLNLTGKISSAQYVEVLEHVAELRDGGDVAVLTMGGLSVADQDRIHRSEATSILPKMSSPVQLSTGGSTSRSRELGKQVEWAKGATREVVVIVDVTTAGTMSISTGDAAAFEYTVAVGRNVLRRPVTIPLTATGLEVTVSSGTAAGSVEQILDYPV